MWPRRSLPSCGLQKPPRPSKLNEVSGGLPMVGLSVSVLLLAPAAAVPAPAPVPAPPPAPAVTAADRNQALNFAHMVYNAAQSVASQYSWPVNEPIDPTYFTQVKKLLGGSIRGLYEAAGLAVPDEAVRAAHSA